MLTSHDRELLARPLFAMITTVPSEGRVPSPRPVWFVLTDDDTIEIFSLAESPRIRRLAADPRASVVVTAPAGESEHWVAIEGSVTVETEGAQELATRLSQRYWFDGVIEDWSSMDLVRITLTPEKVRRFSA